MTSTLELGERAARAAYGDHLLGVYEDDDQRIALAAAFVGRGARTGNRIVYRADGVDVDRLFEVLRSEGGVEPDRLVGSGQLVIEDAIEVYVRDRFEPRGLIESLERVVAESLRSGYPGVFIVGELGERIPGAVPSDLLLTYEAMAEVALRNGSTAALCQYRVDAVPTDLLARLDRVNDARVACPPTPLARFEPTADGGLRIRGEIDLTNAEALGRALRSAAAGVEDCVVDCRRLGFIDASGLREIVRTAAELSRGHRVVLRDAPPMLVRMIELVVGDPLPSLVVREVAR